MKMETVAILSTGEMGHSVASVLGSHGLRVVTCLAGRSARTVGLAKKAGTLNLSTLKEVAVQSDLVISIVVPSAARPLAEAFSLAIAETRKPVLFADANAVSAMTSLAIEAVITAAGGRFVDACIIGAASQLDRGTTFYASGLWASEFAGLNNFGLKVEILGDRAGQASAFKIVYAGLTKGVTSLVLELLLLAHGLGISEPIIEMYRAKFPDIVRFMETTLSSLPFRAGRKSEEMEELISTIEEAGMTPVMAPACRRLLVSLGELNLRAEYSDADEEKWDMQTVLALLHKRLSRKDAPVK